MFKNLKEKLKGWAKRATEDEETEIIEVEEKKPKKAKKTSKDNKKAPKASKADQNTPKQTKKTQKDDQKDTKKSYKTESKNDEKPSKPKENAPKLITEETKEAPEHSTLNAKPSAKPSFLNKLMSKKGKKTPEEPQSSTIIPQPSDDVVVKKKSFLKRALTEDKFNDIFDELELILMQNNIAYEAIEALKESLKEKLVGESTKINIEDALKETIKELLQNPPNFIKNIKWKLKENTPYIIMFAGINGAGKTTTIAKVANLLKKNKLSVCLAAADTFRAAAIEQLSQHADKLKIPLIKKDYGSDPASVGFDAVAYAKKNKIDIVLIDTAGRMNNRDTLMKEIEKIQKVTNPNLTILLGESITGNDATQQAKDFNNSIKIDGIILSKADVDEKGGTAISVSYVTKKPIYFLGMGQGYDDLEIFDKEKLVDRIFGED